MNTPNASTGPTNTTPPAINNAATSLPPDPSIRQAVEQYAKEVFLPVVVEVANKTRQDFKEEIARRDERIEHLEYWNELMGGALFDTIQRQAEHQRGLADAFDEIAKMAEREESPATVAAIRGIAEAIREASVMSVEATLQAGKEASPQQMADLSERWAATVKGVDPCS